MPAAKANRTGRDERGQACSRLSVPRRLAAVACRLAVGACAAASLLAQAAGHGFIAADLANHVVLQIAAATLILLPAALALRLRRTALIAVLALAVLGTTVAPAADWPGAAAYAGDRSERASGTVRLVTLNVLASNDRHGQTLDYLRQEAADIVVLSEGPVRLGPVAGGAPRPLSVSRRLCGRALVRHADPLSPSVDREPRRNRRSGTDAAGRRAGADRRCRATGDRHPSDARAVAQRSCRQTGPGGVSG